MRACGKCVSGNGIGVSQGQGIQLHPHTRCDTDTHPGTPAFYRYSEDQAFGRVVNVTSQYHVYYPLLGYIVNSESLSSSLGRRCALPDAQYYQLSGGIKNVQVIKDCERITDHVRQAALATKAATVVGFGQQTLAHANNRAFSTHRLHKVTPKLTYKQQQRCTILHNIPF